MEQDAYDAMGLVSHDAVEHQIGQVDLLMAMYPDETELSLDVDSQHTLRHLRAVLEGSPPPPELSAQPHVNAILTLNISQIAEDDQGQLLELELGFPFCPQDGRDHDTSPNVHVRARQPAWLSKAAVADLNAQIPLDSDDLLGTIQLVQDGAVDALRNAQSAAMSSSVGLSQQSEKTLVRVWFYFPSISTRSKRDDFIINAPAYKITGFLYAGKPGLLCLEGGSQAIDSYMRFIKTESWSDIPAHHKKVSERYREDDISSRVFPDMQEITNTVGDRRGQRANRGDMKAVEEWLTERGLGDALAKVLM